MDQLLRQIILLPEYFMKLHKSGIHPPGSPISIGISIRNVTQIFYQSSLVGILLNHREFGERTT